MSVTSLYKYDIIALDVDSTLINHHKSWKLWHLIRKFPEKKYYIVTFRFRAGLHYVFQDIEDESRGMITENNFAGALSVGSEFQLDRMTIKKLDRITNQQKRARIMKNSGISQEWVDNRRQEIIERKGYLAHSVGAKVIVDDDEEWVKPGAIKYGVRFMNSDDL